MGYDLQWDIEIILTCEIPSETGFRNARGIITKIGGMYGWSIKERETYSDLLGCGHVFAFINTCMEDIQCKVNELIEEEKNNENNRS